MPQTTPYQLRLRFAPTAVQKAEVKTIEINSLVSTDWGNRVIEYSTSTGSNQAVQWGANDTAVLVVVDELVVEVDA